MSHALSLWIFQFKRFGEGYGLRDYQKRFLTSQYNHNILPTMSQKLSPVEVKNLIDPTYEKDELIGKKLVEVLGLKVINQTQRVHTNWGIKSYVGLARTVQSILNGED